MSEKSYYVRWRGKVSGPFSMDALAGQAQGGLLTKHHSLSADKETWTPAGSIEGLFSKPVAVEAPLDPGPVQVHAKSPGPQVPPAATGQWFYSIDDGKEIGPVAFEVLQQLAAAGQLKAEDQVYEDGKPEWAQARQIGGLTFKRPELQLPALVPVTRMRPCYACGQKIGVYAEMCPYCGFSTRGRARPTIAEAVPAAPAATVAAVPDNRPGLSGSTKIAGIFVVLTLPFYAFWTGIRLMSPMLFTALMLLAGALAIAAFVLAIVGAIQSKSKVFPSLVLAASILFPVGLPAAVVAISSAVGPDALHSRIRDNCFAAYAACKAFAEAEEVYHRTDYNKDGVLEYAQALKGDNSLIETKSGLGDLGLIDRNFANAEVGPNAVPKAGYLFKILKGQGPAASEGQKSYITDKTHMTLGCALVAYPAEYGVSGLDTYMVNQIGTVYHADLGDNTAAIVLDMTEFNPEKEKWTAIQ